MSGKLTRRQILAAGAASTGVFLGIDCNSSQSQDTPQMQKSKGPGREAFWEPGPNKNLVR